MATSVQFWWQAVRAVQAVAMQADRFEEALRELQQAEDDARQRRLLNADTDVARSQREGYEREPLSNRPVRVPSMALDAQVTSDFGLLVVTIRKLLIAQDRLPKRLRPQLAGREELELLRHTVEHWEEGSGRSASKLREIYPRFTRDFVQYDRREIWIGGKEAGVQLSRIWAWAEEMWRAIRTVLVELGEDVPEDWGESMVIGDDALPWPPERITYSWTTPLAPEETWPRLLRSTRQADI